VSQEEVTELQEVNQVILSEKCDPFVKVTEVRM
jgi:hypothetical protein